MHYEYNCGVLKRSAVLYCFVLSIGYQVCVEHNRKTPKALRNVNILLEYRTPSNEASASLIASRIDKE